MLADERGHAVQLCAAEAAALVEADGVKPELGQVLVTFHVDVRRLGPVTGVEEKPVGASPEHGRHVERWHREWPGGNARSASADRNRGSAGRRLGVCRRLTPELSCKGVS